jgi:hypothetical protein
MEIWNDWKLGIVAAYCIFADGWDAWMEFLGLK